MFVHKVLYGLELSGVKTIASVDTFIRDIENIDI